MRKLFLLLALIVAGVQSAWADDIYNYERDTVVVNGVKYERFYNYDWWLSTRNAYELSVIGFDNPGTSVTIQESLPVNEHFHKVKTVGRHSYIENYPTIYYYHAGDRDEEAGKNRATWKDDTGVHKADNYQSLSSRYAYSSVDVMGVSGLKTISFKGSIDFYGNFTSNEVETINFQKDVTIRGNMLVVGLKNLNLGGKLTLKGTLTSYYLTEIHFNDLDCSGKFECRSLTDVYFPALKYEWVLFSGSSFTGVSFSGSQWEDHFPSSLKKQIRAHVWDLTSEQIASLRSRPIWCDFKEIVNHKSNVNYTIVSDGNATINFVELQGNASYVSATGTSQLASASSGSKSGTVKSGGNYAVEIRDVDFNAKNVQLLRNGSVATLEPYVDQGQPIRFHEDLDLQQDVRYEVNVSDKTCTLTFNQTGYTGRIMYQKTLNGTTSTGVITASSPTVACARGSQLKLTIPYDQYTPNVLRLDGSEVTMTKANGEATATITVPAAATADVDLSWQEPQQQDPPHHQPEIMIMRSGEGNILFKGLCAPPEEQAQAAYEQQFGYPAENGVVVSAVSNCTNTVTTVTVPDYDFLGRGEGYEFDAMEWGFRAEITPVAGQTLKNLLVGYIDEEDGRETIIWEDLLYGENYGMYVHPEYNYVTYNESTNTYTFNWGLDEMNVWIGDYVLNIGLGPEETAVETGKTLNFVRQGGRGDSFIEWYDESGRDFYFEEGSTSKTIPNEELQDDDLKMYIDIEEGEVLHVYKNGADITSQFQLNGQSTTEYWAPLEEESATYTLLIDDAPDANPTWSIHNATEGDVIVEQTLKDGTTETATFAGNLNDLVIDDTQVSKVTLKVYAENANEAKPVRVLVNGQDVSYQFNDMVNDGDGFRLCYEVPVSALTNCSWDISYNTDHQQTIVVKGGSRELLVEVERKILYGGPNLCIFRNDGPATIYLPPFNSEYNSNIDMVVYANAGEGVTIKRNGFDVTALFEEKAESGYKYYELDINDADFEGDNTVSQFGFDIRDAAVWEIVYRSIDEQMKTLRVSNLDQMEIVYERNYTDGSTASEYFKNSETGEIAKYVERFFDDSDRENTSSVYLKVPIDEGCPVRVVRDGVDVSYQFTEYDLNLGYLIYEASLTQNQTWDISYETSHRQTFIRKGGTKSWNVEVELDYPIDGNEKYFSPDAVGTPLYVDFPTYNSIYAPNAYIYIDVEDGSSFSVLRNGVDVTDKFTLVTGSAGASAGFTRYALDESDYDDNDDGTTPRLGFTFRDPAVWEITIGDTDRYDVNRDGKISIADVTKLVNKILGKE